MNLSTRFGTAGTQVPLCFDINPTQTKRAFRAGTCAWLSVAAGFMTWTCPITASESSTTAAELAEAGPHHRIWKKGRGNSAPISGREIETSPATCVELATGLNYWDATAGRWEASRAEFEISAQGYAIAKRGQHKVILSPRLDDAHGAVDLQTPDGKRMRSTLLALNLYNRRSRQSQNIAMTDAHSMGQLTAPNEIVFTDAFQGLANVRYLYEKGAFHQDVILTKQLDFELLASAGFPVDDSNLEIWTEFFETPEPVVKTRMVRREKNPARRSAMAEADVSDDTLDFGTMKMREGKAYLQGLAASEREIAVDKRWVKIDGRRFLVESIALDAAAGLLAQLPKGKSIEDLIRANAPYTGRQAPPKLHGRKSGETILLASLDLRQSLAKSPQLVLDPALLVSTASPFTFRGDTTYLVSGAVVLSANGNVVEGGTVVKFKKGCSRGAPQILFLGSVEFQTDFYRPAVFTAEDDHTVGERLTMATFPSGFYGQTALEFDFEEDVEVKHVRISYPYRAIRSLQWNGGPAPAKLNVRHAQIQNCAHGLDVEYEVDANVSNALLVNVTRPFAFTGEVMLRAANVTVNNASVLVDETRGGASDYYFHNSIFANVANLGVTGPGRLNGGHNLFVYPLNPFGAPAFVADDPPFQTMHAGGHYLADDTYRDTGTTNIPANLLADLGSLTTFPPAEQSFKTISSTTVWSPVVSRDNDGSVDLGYHYPAVDYLVASVTINRATLLLRPGVVVASFWSDSAFILGDGGELISQGRGPCHPNHICPYNAVQEQIARNASPNTTKIISSNVQTLSAPGRIQARYTRFHGMADVIGSVNVANVALDFRNCSFHASRVMCEPPLFPQKVDMANNLFERAAVTFTSNQGSTVHFHNNTAINSTLDFNGSFDAAVRDNLFDHCQCTINAGGISSGNNAHRLGTISGLSSTELMTSVPYLTGPFGNRYIASPYAAAWLVDAGSRTAIEAGLSGYTMQLPEAQDVGPVDIGYHYPVSNWTGGTFWTDSVASAEQMAQAIMAPLAANGVAVVPGSAIYTGADVASGFFGNGSNADLPIESGVMLCSGNIHLSHGPNNRIGEHLPPPPDPTGTGSHPGELHNLDGDGQLDLLQPAGPKSWDAAVLEFEISSPAAVNFAFDYVFASEEYHFYIGDFNDIMAIWVDGINIAEVQDPGPPLGPWEPVGVAFIHDGREQGDPTRNEGYFVDNERRSPRLNIQYNGLTTKLTTRPLTLSPGTHRVKIAVEDIRDTKLDSAVFIHGTTSSCP